MAHEAEKRYRVEHASGGDGSGTTTGGTARKTLWRRVRGLGYKVVREEAAESPQLAD
jgi:hypothetical protein